MQDVESYSNIPTIWRLVRNLHDSTGSRMLLESVTCLSQRMSTIHRIPDTVNKLISLLEGSCQPQHGQKNQNCPWYIDAAICIHCIVMLGSCRPTAGLPVVWIAVRHSENRYNEGWGGNWNTVMEGISRESGAWVFVDDRSFTYLIMKIHLQVVLAAIAPPTIGPTRRAKALVMEMCATICAYFSGGTRSMMMIVQREKDPPPPMP